MKISLCLATYNEEQTIKRAIASCIDWVDEVVIVDGSSEDRTVDVAKSFGKKVHVIITDNPPLFHINKQKAIDATHGDWVLQLDADEAVSQELKREILDTVQNPTADGYWIPRKNYFLGRFLEKGGQYPDYTIRLYRRGKGRLPCRDVHEQATIEGEVGYLQEPLLHYADPTFERYLMRWDRYTSLEAQLLNKQGKELCTICYFIGKPLINFLSLYIRHRGYVDGFAGFVFALFSSIRFWVIYIKWWQEAKHFVDPVSSTG